MKIEEALNLIESELTQECRQSIPPAAREAWEQVQREAKLGAVAREHWKILLTAGKRWQLQLDLQNITPHPDLIPAVTAFSAALKEAGI